jgi:hypothetical protein
MSKMRSMGMLQRDEAVEAYRAYLLAPPYLKRYALSGIVGPEGGPTECGTTSQHQDHGDAIEVTWALATAGARRRAESLPDTGVDQRGDPPSSGPHSLPAAPASTP